MKKLTEQELYYKNLNDKLIKRKERFKKIKTQSWEIAKNIFPALFIGSGIALTVLGVCFCIFSLGLITHEKIIESKVNEIIRKYEKEQAGGWWTDISTTNSIYFRSGNWITYSNTFVNNGVK